MDRLISIKWNLNRWSLAMDRLCCFLCGMCAGVWLLFLALHIVNIDPVEQPMIEVCLQVGSELKSYDKTSFECVNRQGLIMTLSRDPSS